MKIQIDPHTLERAEERGTNEQEIIDAVETGFFMPAKQGRLRKAKIYGFQQQWRDRYYEQKRVEVVYIIEGETAVTVTIYVFYGTWERENANPV